MRYKIYIRSRRDIIYFELSIPPEREILISTGVKVPTKFWDNEKKEAKRGLDNYENINLNIRSKYKNLEDILIKAEVEKKKLTANQVKEFFLGVKVGSSDFETFVRKHIELHTGKFSKGRINHLNSCLTHILEFKSKLSFSDINLEFLQSFEKWLRNGREEVTILTKMSAFLSFLNAAEKKDLIDRKQYSSYKRPSAKRKIPIYLTEDEIKAFQKSVEGLGHEKKRNAGYYFLLSCYTGYRISDCEAFAHENIRDGVIIIRAKKNGEIVSLPISPTLQNILDHCTGFINTQQDAREFVKKIAEDSGFKKWQLLKFHSGRHSFAMFCLSRGLSKDQVAELLGDSRDVVEVYARIINTDLHKAAKERLF